MAVTQAGPCLGKETSWWELLQPWSRCHPAWDHQLVSAQAHLAAGAGGSLASCSHPLPECFPQSLSPQVPLGLVVYNPISHDGSFGRADTSTGSSNR